LISVLYKANNLLLIISSLLIIFSCIGCDKKTEISSDSLPKINFTVNPDLLGTKIYDSSESFEFNPPYFLIYVMKDSLNFFERKLQNENVEGDYDISVLYLFKDSTSRNSLAVSKIVFHQDSTFNLVDKYSENLKKEKLFSKASKAEFYKDKLLMTQFLLNYEEHVFIKIIIEGRNNDLLQFDYVLFLNDYKNEVRSIESSIGSINLYQ
jgi:hypothetical protein